MTGPIAFHPVLFPGLMYPLRTLPQKFFPPNFVGILFPGHKGTSAPLSFSFYETLEANLEGVGIPSSREPVGGG